MAGHSHGISTEAVAKKLHHNGYPLPGVPAIITTDQGGQFSLVFLQPKTNVGNTTNSNHPFHFLPNGMVERLHRTPKQAIRVTIQKGQSLTSGLGLRACIKEDLNALAKWYLEKTLVLPGNSFNLQVRPQLIPPSFL
ncbi:hypothetical protein TNIN_66341 [Trichonephila inaurata madagascariensis]|uniref:Integrase catalytic domain-containing protein n=1 Tax=Trichonephila inaurata madagascariensis TaxID=2747483 RepID=A0A8X6YA99_9ARAC|nr:hypothetical protein TNIN_66341 [Trichonephila inaurata madagascariensis]